MGVGLLSLGPEPRQPPFFSGALGPYQSLLTYSLLTGQDNKAQNRGAALLHTFRIARGR